MKQINDEIFIEAIKNSKSPKLAYNAAKLLYEGKQSFAYVGQNVIDGAWEDARKFGSAKQRKKGSHYRKERIALSFQEIEIDLPEDAMRWRKRDPHWEPPEGGESLLTLDKRIRHTLNSLAAKHPGEHIAVFAHGGVMDILYRIATGQDLLAPRTWALTNTAINRLLWTPQSVYLVGWADTSHLDDVSRDEY